MTQNYLRYETLSLEEVLPDIKLYWNESKRKIQHPNGKWYGITSLRLKTFYRAARSPKGLECVRCGLVGAFFALETTPGQESTHLNLYGIKDDTEILFTHDHKHARALGGADNLSNTQVMCSPCNGNKAKGESKEAARRRKLGEKQNVDD
jgi:hypothetical protein